MKPAVNVTKIIVWYINVDIIIAITSTDNRYTLSTIEKYKYVKFFQHIPHGCYVTWTLNELLNPCFSITDTYYVYSIYNLYLGAQNLTTRRLAMTSNYGKGQDWGVGVGRVDVNDHGGTSRWGVGAGDQEQLSRSTRVDVSEKRVFDRLTVVVVVLRPNHVQRDALPLFRQRFGVVRDRRGHRITADRRGDARWHTVTALSLGHRITADRRGDAWWHTVTALSLGHRITADRRGDARWQRYHWDSESLLTDTVTHGDTRWQRYHWDTESLLTDAVTHGDNVITLPHTINLYKLMQPSNHRGSRACHYLSS